jgi:hypothetical protein
VDARAVTAKIIPFPSKMPASMRESLQEIAAPGPVNPKLVEVLELLLKNAKEGRIHSFVGVHGTDDEPAATGLIYAGIDRGGFDIPGFNLWLEEGRESVKDFLGGGMFFNALDDDGDDLPDLDE